MLKIAAPVKECTSFTGL